MKATRYHRTIDAAEVESHGYRRARSGSSRRRLGGGPRQDALVARSNRDEWCGLETGRRLRPPRSIGRIDYFRGQAADRKHRSSLTISGLNRDAPPDSDAALDDEGATTSCAVYQPAIRLLSTRRALLTLRCRWSDDRRDCPELIVPERDRPEHRPRERTLAKGHFHSRTIRGDELAHASVVIGSSTLCSMKVQATAGDDGCARALRDALHSRPYPVGSFREPEVNARRVMRFKLAANARVGPRRTILLMDSKPRAVGSNSIRRGFRGSRARRTLGGTRGPSAAGASPCLPSTQAGKRMDRIGGL